MVEVKTAQQLQPFDKEFTKVSLYLSLWNVHVNWIPASGEIIFLEYKKGKFYPAFQNRASKQNESNLIGIRTEQGDIFVKQIAGLIARRIICTVSEGDTVTIGQKFGMIKFGSRVELFLPASIELTISPGDMVRGGETIIGKFNEN
ncbi:MAG: phosphatidylserine decarboxylase [bacterium]